MKKYFEGYSEDVLSIMVSYSSGLTTAQRRHYAALESLKLGHGEQSYVSRVLGIGRIMIGKGVKELKEPLTYPPLAEGRHRKDGGGRDDHDWQYLLPNLPFAK